jgi:hypothetical protein
VLKFNKRDLATNYNIQIKRSNLAIKHITMLFKSSIYAIVFHNRPNCVEFYDVDLQQAANNNQF